MSLIRMDGPRLLRLVPSLHSEDKVRGSNPAS